MAKNSKRGLGSADERTRKDVASRGGKAYHEKRGAHGTDRRGQEQESENQ